ncbi:MAG: biotin synthase BioB [Muribaculaceae bacterium]|nr:biotin synthase BioB [Muribaculaceae bacterium]
MDLLSRVKENAIKGIPCSVDDALKISELYDINDICDAADEVRIATQGNSVDTCSIVNARSGRCTEDCKWCAQSRHYQTGCGEYEQIDEKELFNAVKVNTEKGVNRFSMVTSGRKVSKADIGSFCSLYRRIRQESPIHLCASMGLLDKEQLQQLKDAGVTRYHCNLETGPSYFPHLCTTHTMQDKLNTIRAAREVGMEVCSGGIIGMGETMRDRLEMAETAREAGACSIPVNILNPIKGTPLQDTTPLSEEEIILTVALLRLVAPLCALRFAGGRLRLSEKATRRILRGGMNGALVGDMLTTVGNNIDSDRSLFENLDFKW